MRAATGRQVRIASHPSTPAAKASRDAACLRYCRPTGKRQTADSKQSQHPILSGTRGELDIELGNIQHSTFDIQLPSGVQGHLGMGWIVGSMDRWIFGGEYRTKDGEHRTLFKSKWQIGLLTCPLECLIHTPTLPICSMGPNFAAWIIHPDF